MSWAAKPDRISALLRTASAAEVVPLGGRWSFWARPEQLPPDGGWRTWVFLGGRGAGKTRAGAEWVRAEIEGGRRSRIALVGATLADVREVMIEGPSGLAGRSVRGAPRYESSRRRLLWPNGAVAYAFSAEDPDALRGPQFDGAWLDEFAAWKDPQAAYDVLQFGLRVGTSPRQVVTTTPRPLKALRRLIAARETVVTHASTAANLANLAPGFFAAINAVYAGSRLGRQELHGELLDDGGGGLWPRPLVSGAIARPPDALDRIVVAVDPPASQGERAAACGIIVAGAAGDGVRRSVWVLADRTLQGASPGGWARRAVEAAHEFDADRIVAEVNQGGAMVRALLQVVDPTIGVTEVRATRGKRARAEPIAALYESGRVFHAGRFVLLEDEMCAFGGAEAGSRTFDRVDALVWAVTALMSAGGGIPRLRSL